MRTIALATLALIPLTGCVSLHAELPEEMVRHIAAEDGVELAALCSHEDRHFSEGAVACMEARPMACDPTGRWIELEGGCN